MRYFQDDKGEVFGYDEDQTSLISVAKDNMVEITGSWPPKPSKEFVAEEVRSRRSALLAQCDWTQLADAPVDQTSWSVYRQALRDMPQQEGFPHSVVWPTKP